MQVEKCNPKYWEQNQVPPPPLPLEKIKWKKKKELNFLQYHVAL